MTIRVSVKHHRIIFEALLCMDAEDYLYLEGVEHNGEDISAIVDEAAWACIEEKAIEKYFEE